MRAAAILFDSFGTLFDLEALRPRLTAMGPLPRELEVWLARTLRDGIALSVAGAFRPFREVAASTLTALVAELGQRPDPTQVEQVVAELSELPTFRDVAPALMQLSDAGLRRGILSNASAEMMRTLLERAGIADKLHAVVSIDEVRRWKPAPETYRRAADALGVNPGKIAYVSASPWDVEGARSLGMYGVLLQRRGGHHQKAMPLPDLTIAGLAELVQVGAHPEPLA